MDRQLIVGSFRVIRLLPPVQNRWLVVRVWVEVLNQYYKFVKEDLILTETQFTRALISWKSSPYFEIIELHDPHLNSSGVFLANKNCSDQKDGLRTGRKKRKFIFSCEEGNKPPNSS